MTAINWAARAQRDARVDEIGTVWALLAINATLERSADGVERTAELDYGPDVVEPEPAATRQPAANFWVCVVCRRPTELTSGGLISNHYRPDQTDGPLCAGSGLEP